MKHKKILMVTMSMGLGGAETHILELAKGLKAKGHDVILCSNGGVYVDELVKAGIPHYDAPLHIRTVSSLMEGFRTLKTLLKTEKPDIVHAHARIPALLCNYLCKVYHIPFLTTAHYNFKTTGIFKYFTRWGQKTIAVSEDLKNYLITNYNLKPNDITVTVNGIATDKFSTFSSAEGLYEELNIPKDGEYVVTVSRMDTNACKAAELLIKGAKEPCLANPKLYVIIVGSGNQLETLTAQANQINQAVGRRCVIMTGGRTDISKFTALCNVFVGVSRSALEAMACEKPTILAGNQGYLGLYTAAILKDCIATNFTCRGIPYPSDTIVWESVLPLLKGKTPKDITMDEIKNQSRAIILSNYSVEKMAGDAETAYAALLALANKEYDFVVTGYYGHNNSGDEALLSAVIKNLQIACPNATICALTSAPIDTQNTCHVTAVQRFNLLAVNRVFNHAKVLVFGGGNLIQDVTSTKSLLYYTTLLNTANKKNMKTMLYANGIGPIQKSANRKLAASALNRCDVITLRDKDSYQLLKEIGVTKPLIKITADETLTLTLPKEDTIQKILTQHSLTSNSYLVISVRHFNNTSPSFFKQLAGATDVLATKFNLKIVLIPMHAHTDVPACDEFSRLLQNPSLVISQAQNLEETMAIIGQSSAVIGMRMHALVFAACSFVPFAGLAYDPKVESFTKGFEDLHYYQLNNFNPKEFEENMEQLLNNRCEISKNIKQTVKLWQESAKSNAQLAKELLDSHGKKQ